MPLNDLNIRIVISTRQLNFLQLLYFKTQCYALSLSVAAEREEKKEKGKEIEKENSQKDRNGGKMTFVPAIFILLYKPLMVMNFATS